MLQTCKSRFLLLALTIISLTACQSDSEQSTTAEDTSVGLLDTLSFGRATFSEISKSCVTDSIRCAKAMVSYPTARGGDAAVAERINITIRNVVASAVGLFGEPDSIQLNPREAAKAFVMEYDTFLAETPDSPAGWASETNGEVLYKDDRVLTVELNTYAYSGGAHPNGYVHLLNFDLETGELLKSTDLIQDTTGLKQIAEKAFRVEREIAPEADLSESGFWFDNGFMLPVEMGMTTEGLKLMYNPYEVGPYVMGSTELVIPTEQLGDILQMR